MATNTSRAQKRRLSTTQKSSASTTEKPLNESEDFSEESDETSTLTETSSLNSTSDEDVDPNEAIFAEADAKAAEAAESDDDDADDDEADVPVEEIEKAMETAPVVPADGILTEPHPDFGDPLTFVHPEYTFPAYRDENSIRIAADVYREVPLPGSKRKGKILVFAKGRVLPFAAFESYLKA